MEFSVLLSVYKKENPDFLKESLESIYENQILKPSEIVLVQDGPLTKELDEVVNHKVNMYPDIFKIVKLEKNMGLGYALNEGIKECSYELIARMDTDDIATTERFHKQITFMYENTNIDVLGGMLEEFEAFPGDLSQFRLLPESQADIFKFAKFRNPINHPTVVYKKSKVQKVGGYQTDVLFWEDYLLWVDMLNAGCEFHNLNQNVLHFRVQDGLHMIKKRRGFKYAINEIKFAKYCRKNGFFSFYDYLKYVLIKPPLRLIPSSILYFIYKKFSRN